MFLPRCDSSKSCAPASDDSVPLELRDIPIDDEPETEEERAAVAEARREIEEGQRNPPR